MKEINNMTVKYHNRVVGILAETKEGTSAFQYDNMITVSGVLETSHRIPNLESEAHNFDKEQKTENFIYR